MSESEPSGSFGDSIAVECFRHYGDLETAIAALKAVSGGRIALDAPGVLVEIATLKAEVARLTEENKALREQAGKPA